MSRLRSRGTALAGAVLLAVLHGLAVLGPAHAAPAPPHALPGATPLDTYLEGLTTLRASFLQTLADPQGREIDRATGTLIVQRPGKFSWEIHPEGAAANSGGQLMVGDGRNVWYYDRDLDQVTVKPADAVLTVTPAMLLSGTVELRKAFNVSPAGNHEGLDWVRVEPKSSTQSDFGSAAFGFDHGALKSLRYEDKRGQVATYLFAQAQRNGPVSPAEVSFTPPPGTDVIGKPQ
jgi:outer membrane lipoprotein carrier protein